MNAHEIVIRKFNKKYKNKYDYSLVQYVDAITKLQIICPKHNIFEVSSSDHLRGYGCPQCKADKNKIYNNKLIEKTKIIHQNKIDNKFIEKKINQNKNDCSTTILTNLPMDTKIVCPKHGIFNQKMKDHLEGEACKNCEKEEKFIKKSSEIHNNIYDYSLINYINTKTSIIIKCKVHNILFEQIPSEHLKNSSCSLCISDKNDKLQLEKNENFIRKAKLKHGDKYDYSFVNYINGTSKVKIICPIHNEFEQTAINHIKGSGCLKCGIISSSEKNRMSTEEFIERSKKIHGDKYDYSLTDYVDYATKIIIICKEHGKFNQRISSHLEGKGCFECNGRPKLTQNEFIDRAIDLYNDSFNYELINYVNLDTSITIKCNIHDIIFDQKPSKHLIYKGCPECIKDNKNNKNQEKKSNFINKAKAKYNDKYDYSKVDYRGSFIDVEIICPIHNSFFQKPVTHLNNHECIECEKYNLQINGITKHNNVKLTQDEFINRATKMHGNKYNYELTKYTSMKNTVIIKCNICNKSFNQIADDHINGSGCQSCAKKIIANKVRSNNDEFIEKAKIKHGNYYDYSKVHYIDSQTKVIIICPIHNEFSQKPVYHLNSNGCPFCNGTVKITKEVFIEKAKKNYNDIFNYDEINYININTPIEIKCNLHNIFFNQSPKEHLKRHKCNICNNATKKNKFIENANKKHGNKYNYNLVEFINYETQIKIKCPKHGIFEQTPSHHLKTNGCFKCSKSNYSKKQIQWLDYLMKRDNIYIQHACNDGEYRIDKYKIDGYCAETNTCFEFNGLLFHGSPRLYNPEYINPINGKRMGDLYQATLNKEKYIRDKGYNLVVMWEDEWDNFVKTNNLNLNEKID